MALLHDLAEAETGDLTPTQKYTDPVGFKHAENAAMERLLEKLPGDIRGTFRASWQEFSDNLTDEARLVRDADKLEMVIQALEYQKEGGNKSSLMRFWHAEINGEEARTIRDAVRARGRDRIP
jgi:putative hydrolase of HD superfamily